MSQSYIGGIERGERTPDLRLVDTIDGALDAAGRLTRLWNTLSGDGEPVWLEDLSGLQRTATAIAEVDPVLFPALLQRENYAESAIRTLSPWLSLEDVKASLTDRMQRSQRFLDSTAVYRAVLDSATLRRAPDNDQGVLAEQIGHVVDLIERRRISVQVVVNGWHPGLVGAFTLIASPASPEVVYVESAHSGRVLDDPQVVQRFRVLLGDLQAVAMPPDDTLRMLRDELERLKP